MSDANNAVSTPPTVANEEADTEILTQSLSNGNLSQKLQVADETLRPTSASVKNVPSADAGLIKEQVAVEEPSLINATAETDINDKEIVPDNQDNVEETVVENVPAEPVRDPNLVEITLRPVDKGWVMGEDWTVDLHNMMTLVDIKGYVEKFRGISKHRIQLRLKGKVFQPNREIWTLRRLGIYDGYVIQVEPTLSGSWLWNPLEYYQLKLLDEVCAIVENTTSLTSSGRISMKALSLKIQPPPCIKTSLRVFLRQYPERIYIHTDTTDHELWVHVSKRAYQLPTFGNFSVEIGSFPYFKVKRFDWAANKDIDDMYKIEALPAEEEAALQEDMARLAAEALKSGKGTAENSAAHTVEDAAKMREGEPAAGAAAGLVGDGSVAEDSVLTEDQQANAALTD